MVETRKNNALCHLSRFAGTLAICSRCGFVWDDMDPDWVYRLPLNPGYNNAAQEVAEPPEWVSRVLPRGLRDSDWAD